MRAYQIAAASVAMCSGLLFASYLKAAEVDPVAPVAQMNRAGYAAMAGGDALPVFVPPRRPHDLREAPAAVAQMNRGLHAQPAPLLVLPRHPDDQRQYVPVSAQSNRVLYDR